METQDTENWTLDDFKLLAEARGMPIGWAEREFTFRRYNNFSAQVPAGWKAPSDVAATNARYAKSNNALKNVVIVFAIFYLIPKLFEKYGRNKIGP